MNNIPCDITNDDLLLRYAEKEQFLEYLKSGNLRMTPLKTYWQHENNTDEAIGDKSDGILKIDKSTLGNEIRFYMAVVPPDYNTSEVKEFTKDDENNHIISMSISNEKAPVLSFAKLKANNLRKQIVEDGYTCDIPCEKIIQLRDAISKEYKYVAIITNPLEYLNKIKKKHNSIIWGDIIYKEKLSADDIKQLSHDYNYIFLKDKYSGQNELRVTIPYRGIENPIYLETNIDLSNHVHICKIE